MKRFLKFVLCLVFCISLVPLTWAQEDPAVVAKRLTEDFWRFSLVPFVDNSLASPDGHYLAQNPAELQTYHDLELSYRYIDEEYLRKQLGLPNDQGIIVTTAKESGEGFKNGFRNGDIVLQVDDESVVTQYDLVIALTKNRGQQRSAKIRRDGSEMDLVVVLSESDVQTPTHWIIGVFVDEISDVTKAQLNIEGGAAITQLTEEGPAIKTGVVVHDIITHINGKLINNLEELKQIVSESEGEELTLDIVRMGKKIRLELDPLEVTDGRIGMHRRYYSSAMSLREFQYHQNAALAHPLYVPAIVQTDFAIESTSVRLDRLEESIKRIENLLKDQLEDSDDD